jgi:DMSO/TMAO reductase YedYZ molybdopterin-dependent catalytic subunit
MSSDTFSRAIPRPITPSVVTREQNPPNLEYAFAALDSFVTPVEHFYVRSHFKVPAIDPATYRLQVNGEVDRPLELSLDELKSMKSVTRPATLECAGNGRVLLEPQVPGAQWELGAVSNAMWTGVPLGDLLGRAGVKAEAVEIIFEGTDRGRPKESPVPPGEIHYAHSIPLRKIPDAMVAYAMNDRPLTAEHGFPARVVVPGWYGMASVKWVTRIIATAEDFRGYFRTVDYAYWDTLAGNPVRVPIEEMAVKAQIARPAKNEIVPRNTDYLITGAAWTGDTSIAKVEVSTDGGQSYATATLIGESQPRAWRLWEHPWRTPSTPGPVTLMARATDARGRTQPVERDPRFGTYVIGHVLKVEAVVE